MAKTSHDICKQYDNYSYTVHGTVNQSEGDLLFTLPNPLFNKDNIIEGTGIKYSSIVEFKNIGVSVLIHAKNSLFHSFIVTIMLFYSFNITI